MASQQQQDRAEVEHLKRANAELQELLVCWTAQSLLNCDHHAFICQITIQLPTLAGSQEGTASQPRGVFWGQLQLVGGPDKDLQSKGKTIGHDEPLLLWCMSICVQTASEVRHPSSCVRHISNCACHAG